MKFLNLEESYAALAVMNSRDQQVDTQLEEGTRLIREHWERYEGEIQMDWPTMCFLHTVALMVFAEYGVDADTSSLLQMVIDTAYAAGREDERE